MKTCPHCHIQVGGSAQYCPLCQNPLVGTPEPDRYPKVVSPARRLISTRTITQRSA